MSFLEERDLVRVGRDARAWLLQDRDLARRGSVARDWLMHDERGRVVGIIVFSVAISILMSLVATAIVSMVSRRRAAAPDGPAPEAIGEPLAAVDAPAAAETPAGVPVMDAVEAPLVESHVEG